MFLIAYQRGAVEPGGGVDLVEDKGGCVGARDGRDGDAVELIGGAEAAAEGTLGEAGGTNDGPIELARADESFLTVFVLVVGPGEERENDVVIEPAAVAFTVASADAGDGDEPRDVICLHGLDQDLRGVGEEGYGPGRGRIA